MIQQITGPIPGATTRSRAVSQHCFGEKSMNTSMPPTHAADRTDTRHDRRHRHFDGSRVRAIARISRRPPRRRAAGAAQHRTATVSASAPTCQGTATCGLQSVTAAIEAVELAIDNLVGKSCANVGGYSMGGRLALQLASRNPSRVKAVAVLSSNPVLRAKTSSGARSARCPLRTGSAPWRHQRSPHGYVTSGIALRCGATRAAPRL